MSSKQIQKAGDNSVNVQGNKVAITTGLTYQDVRQVALDVFRYNFYQLAGVARDIAQDRAEQITDKFLKELESRNPEGLAAATDPDFLYSLFTAQREYARAGDDELGDILVDLLVDRTKEQSRTLIRIVLNESLRVASQLTSDQIALLSLIFTLRYTKSNRIRNIKSLSKYLKTRIAPFIKGLPATYVALQHLEFTGCCSISIASLSLENLMADKYPGLFSKGIPREELADIQIEQPIVNKLLVPCLRDHAKLQISCIDEDVLRNQATKLGVSDDTLEKLVKLDKNHRLKGDDLWKELDAIEPQLPALRKKWESLRFGHVSLTSVGIAIGHANVRRVTGESSPLSIWIN